MLHICVQKFDVTRNLEKFWELNRAIIIDANKGTTSDSVTLCFITRAELAGQFSNIIGAVDRAQIDR